MRRQVEYVRRKRRSAPISLEVINSLADTVDEEFNVHYNTGLNYTDEVVSTVNAENMATIRRYGVTYISYILYQQFSA